MMNRQTNAPRTCRCNSHRKCRVTPLPEGGAMTLQGQTLLMFPVGESFPHLSSRPWKSILIEEPDYGKMLVSVFAPDRCSPEGGDSCETSMKKFRLIDLFCGCGGMTRGFMDTGRFELVYANDNNEAAIESYKANFDPQGSHTVAGDIIELVEKRPNTIPKADIVIGGPPCQGFSLLNKNRIGDKRREMWQYYMEVAKIAGARVIVMENVPQLIDSDEFQQILQVLENQGFKHVVAHVLNAANYGVPETRRRTILIASKIGNVALPSIVALSPERKAELLEAGTPSALPDWKTVRECIGDLPPPVGSEFRPEDGPVLSLHFGRNQLPMSIERMMAVPPGGNRFDLQRNRPDITPGCWIRKKEGGTDLFGRLWWDRPSVTIRTEFFKPEKGRYLHPEQHRPITHREAARIQTFPDTFKFRGSKVEVAKQIGNAVPVLLANAVAKAAVSALERKITARAATAADRQYLDLLGEAIKIRRDN